MHAKRSIIDSMEHRKQAGELYPLTAMLELTHGCNLRCCHCYLEQRNKGGELSTVQWCSFIDQAVDMDVFFAGFTGGEILLRPDFLDIARHAFKRGVFFHLQTNGTLIDEEMAAAIQDLRPTKVDISIYGATAAVHEKITGVSGSFKRAVRAVELLRQRDIKVCLKTTIMEENKDEVPALKKMADGLGAWHAADPVVMPGVFGSSKPVAHRLDNSEYRKYMISVGWGRIPGKELEDLVKDANRPDHRVLCTAAKKRFAISPWGDVMPCVVWRYSCGNLLQQSLKSIWYGKTMASLRQIKFEDLKGCKGCENYESCVRCAGLAYMETGDCMGCSDESRRMSNILKEIKRENRERETGSAPLDSY